MTIIQNCVLLMLLASAAGSGLGGGAGGSNAGGSNVPEECRGGGNRGVDISCSGTRLSLFGKVRNCCETTGLCADSSCVVFGYPNSAKANCPGKWGKCEDVQCVYHNGCNANVDNYDGYCTNLKNHCYGTLTCKPGKECTAANLGDELFAMIGSECLEDGGSDNFKICGPGEPIAPLPTPSPDDGNFNPDSVDVTPQPCEQCDPQYRTEDCKAVEGAKKGWFVVDIPNCESDSLKEIIGNYKCKKEMDGCDTYVCTEHIPSKEFETLTSCPPVIIRAD